MQERAQPPDRPRCPGAQSPIRSSNVWEGFLERRAISQAVTAMVRSVLTIRAAPSGSQCSTTPAPGGYEQQRKVREEAVGCFAKVVGNPAIPDQPSEKQRHAAHRSRYRHMRERHKRFARQLADDENSDPLDHDPSRFGLINLWASVSTVFHRYSKRKIVSTARSALKMPLSLPIDDAERVWRSSSSPRPSGRG